MKIWINKFIETEKSDDFFNALTFNINVPGKNGRISSSIRDSWYRKLGVQSVSSICEDLYILALCIFAVDKRIPRAHTADGWTRYLSVSIPVIELAQWNSVRNDLESMFSYLSGDIWSIEFRQCDPENRYKDTHKRPPILKVEHGKYQAVSLLSGGLDSYCGAYQLLSHDSNTIFVGFKEHGKLESIQQKLLNHLEENFPDTSNLLFTFTAKAYKPLGVEHMPAENTSRSRSFLFLAAAICVAHIAGDNTPVYISENGFIGLNLPLTSSRKGTCSTRTTHPYFLKSFNKLLDKLGIKHKVINPYVFSSKREMIQENIDLPNFIECIHKTISCSHPCNTRWLGKSQPENCGYCYPCLIRKSSLLDIVDKREHYTFNSISFDYFSNATNARRSDLVDLMHSISKSSKESDKTLVKRIKRTGKLTEEESIAFLRLYRATQNDIIELFSCDKNMMRIMGMNYETD